MSFEKLVAYSKEVSAISSAMSLLSWDMETYMPSGSGEARAETLGVLAKVHHQKVSSSEYSVLVEKCKQDSSLSLEQQRLIAEIERDRNKVLKVPEALAVEYSKLTSRAQQEWAKARQTQRPQDFLPWLDQVTEKTKEIAHCIKTSEQTPYDALMDGYERGSTSAVIDSLFETLKKDLVPMIKSIKEAGHPAENTITRAHFDKDLQKKFNEYLLGKMGFDFKHGRIDESAHPFTIHFHPTDVRLTTRYDTHNIIDSLFSTLHEGGHGLYEQGLPKEWAGTPFAEAVSLGIHESQSRFWENCIGRSKLFWEAEYPRLQELFGGAVAGISLDDFYAAINRVTPSFIRVDADEITYTMHIIVRYEVEKALFNGGIRSGDIEEMWNEKMRNYLGIVPPNPLQGYMQDVHWSAGPFGYFPTYSLGNMIAAQLFHTLKRERADFNASIQKGDYSSINEWMSQKIWRHGRRYSPAELIEQATGEPLSPHYFIEYLKEKYSALYRI